MFVSGKPVRDDWHDCEETTETGSAHLNTEKTVLRQTSLLVSEELEETDSSPDNWICLYGRFHWRTVRANTQYKNAESYFCLRWSMYFCWRDRDKCKKLETWRRLSATVESWNWITAADEFSRWRTCGLQCQHLWLCKDIGAIISLNQRVAVGSSDSSGSKLRENELIMLNVVVFCDPTWFIHLSSPAVCCDALIKYLLLQFHSDLSREL